MGFYIKVHPNSQLDEKAKATNNGSFLKLFKILTAHVLSSLKHACSCFNPFPPRGGVRPIATIVRQGKITKGTVLAGLGEERVKRFRSRSRCKKVLMKKGLDVKRFCT